MTAIGGGGFSLDLPRFEHRLAEGFRFGRDAEAGGDGGGQAAVVALRRAVGD